MPDTDKKLHWLMRPSSVRKLCFAFAAVLVAVVAAQTVIYIKGYFGVDAWFGFGAVYGFVSCLLMVLVAKLLGMLLKRPEDYYSAVDEDEQAQRGYGEVRNQRPGPEPKDSAVEEQQGGV